MRKRFGNIIIFSIIAVALIVTSGFLFNWISNLRADYWAIYHGESINVSFSIYENCQGGTRERPGRLWRFRFAVQGIWYTGITTGVYSCPNPRVVGNYWWVGDRNTHIRVVERGGGGSSMQNPPPYRLQNGVWWIEGQNTNIRANVRDQRVRIVLNDEGMPITYPIGEDPNYVMLDGVRHLVVAMAREDGFFEFFDPPGFAMPLTVLGLLAPLLFGIGFNLYFILKDKQVIKQGVFAYALIEDAFWSKWGSRRWMAVRFRYQDEESGEWREDVSHYTFRPHQVAYLKTLEAIGIKYYKDRAVVVERMTSAGPIDPPY